MGRPGVLLDRDGTVIIDHGYVGSIDRVELIDGAAKAIASFNSAGIPVIIVTNQAGVARGLYGVADVEEVHSHIVKLLAEHGAHIDLFLFCPYHQDGIVPSFARFSSDRKPEPGMALAAARVLDLDLCSSWVVGDRSEDMELAAVIGATGVLVGSGVGERKGTWSFPDLGSAAPLILERLEAGVAKEGSSRAPASSRPKFPMTTFDRAGPYYRAYGRESRMAAESVDLRQVERASTVLVDAYRRGGVVFSCGNGGSASVANHLQCDHLKGVRTGTDLWPRVVSLNSNVELMTAIANDLSYDKVFVYQLQSQARAGDVVVAISASGESPNIVRALDWARGHDLRTIALTGFRGGRAAELAEVVVHVDSRNYGVVEDNHQAIMHVLAQYIRQSMMSPDTVSVQTF